MASTYSSSLKIELIGTGEQVGTWGTTTNVNLGTALEEAIANSADVTFSSTNVTLTLTNTNASQTARHLRLRLVGTSGGARTLTLPAVEKSYVIKNELADTVTVKNATGSGVAVASGTSSYVYSTGAGVEEVVSSSIFIPAGVITMWAGAIINIPVGWNLCDGTNGTPNLTDKFVVAAGASYTPNVIYGNPSGNQVTLTTANLPAHTHTFSGGTSGNTTGISLSNTRTPLQVGDVDRGSNPSNFSIDNGQDVTLNDPGHSHSFSGTTAATGSGTAFSIMPSSFALAYIMKL
jgi:microcystin-dependent protein